MPHYRIRSGKILKHFPFIGHDISNNEELINKMTKITDREKMDILKIYTEYIKKRRKIMTNKTNKTTTWTPNENAKDFLNVLKNYANGATLRDIEIDTGKVFKTGLVNTLVSKGLVIATDTEVKVDLVYRDTVIGTITKNWKTYKLA